jgi:hypothetical protein
VNELFVRERERIRRREREREKMSVREVKRMERPYPTAVAAAIAI